MRTRVSICLATILLAVTLAGCSSSPPASEELASTLSDADQLITAALRTWALENDATQALRLAQQAAAAAPKRADIAFLHIRFCTRTPGCDSRSLEARMKKLAPDNAAVWLSVLARVRSERETQVEEQVLAAMGRAEQFDVYWTTLLWRITVALNTNAPPRSGKEAAAPLTAALNDATGWLSALVMPAFEPLSTACSAEKLRDTARRTNCERVAQVLQRGDAYAAEGLGLGIAQRLAAPGSAAAAQVDRRIDTLGYQNHKAGAVMASQLERDKFSAEMLELMKKLPREQDVSLAILRWAGEPFTP